MRNKGVLYLIPNTLGESNPSNVLPQSILSLVENLDYFIVENEKAARKFIKSICPTKSQSTLNLCVLDKHNIDNFNYNQYLSLCSDGISVGLMSDAGCPGIADPGAFVVLEAHRLKLKVVPMVGPSSIFLALMSSGLNGQNFAFSGYLPVDTVDKIKKIKWLELQSETFCQSQIFMETPYRNNKFFDDLTTCLNTNTYLTIACDITLDTEFIETKTIGEWKKNKVDLHHRPCIFIIQKK